MIPSALLCMFIIVAIEFLIVRNCGTYTLTLKDIAAFSSANAYPRPFFINDLYDMSMINDNSTNTIILNAVVLALLAILETTMTQEVVNEYTNSEGNLNKQLISLGLFLHYFKFKLPYLGVGSIFNGFLGVPISGGMLGISTINCVNGGKGRLSSFVAALLVMIIMFGAYPLLNYIPLGVLVGMLFVVVYRLFKWFTITAIIAEILPKRLREKFHIENSRIEILELMIICIVTVLTVVLNLLIASAVGILIAGMAFTYKNSFTMHVKSEIRDKGNKKVKVYTVEGPVYYATKKNFFQFFDVMNDPTHVQIDFDNDMFMDYTFIEALNKLCKKYKDSGREIKIKKLKRKAQKTVEKSHKFANNIEFISEKIELPGVPQFLENHDHDDKKYEIEIQKVKIFYLLN